MKMSIRYNGLVKHIGILFVKSVILVSSFQDTQVKSAIRKLGPATFLLNFVGTYMYLTYPKIDSRNQPKFLMVSEGWNFKLFEGLLMTI